MSERYETVFVHVGCVAFETENALLLEDGSNLWIPKSQIRKESEVHAMEDEGILAIPRWLAEEKGLPYTERITVNAPPPEGARELETVDDYVEKTPEPEPEPEKAPAAEPSSTRSDEELEELDVCPTPPDLALAACKLLRERYGEVSRILEPSAGEGSFVAAMRQVWPNANITAIEIRPECAPLLRAAGADEVLVGDLAKFAVVEFLSTFDLTAGNPPFKKAEEHLRLLFGAMREGSHVDFLLRLGFLEAYERVSFWQEFPEDIFNPIVPRPSFKKNKHGKKGTDSQSYGFFDWTVGDRAAPQSIRRRGDHIVWRNPEKVEKRAYKNRKSKTKNTAGADRAPSGAPAPPALSAPAAPQVTEGPIELE